MLVDRERVLLDLKAEIAAKPSHGARDLLATIARLEAEHAIQHDAYEQFVRTFGHHLEDSFMGLVPRADEDEGPPEPAAASASPVARPPHLRSPTQDSEESCQRPQSRARSTTAQRPQRTAARAA